MTDTVKACPMCGRELRVYCCECTAPGRINPIEMPRVVAERLRELYSNPRKPRKQQRLTASPTKTTVWVQEALRGDSIRGLELMLRIREGTPNPDAAQGQQNHWLRLTRGEWEQLRDTIDGYFETLTPLP